MHIMQSAHIAKSTKRNGFILVILQDPAFWNPGCFNSHRAAGRPTVGNSNEDICQSPGKMAAGRISTSGIEQTQNGELKRKHGPVAATHLQRLSSTRTSLYSHIDSSLAGLFSPTEGNGMLLIKDAEFCQNSQSGRSCIRDLGSTYQSGGGCFPAGRFLLEDVPRIMPLF
jgi:hypothetical protein